MPYRKIDTKKIIVVRDFRFRFFYALANLKYKVRKFIRKMVRR